MTSHSSDVVSPKMVITALATIIGGLWVITVGLGGFWCKAMYEQQVQINGNISQMKVHDAEQDKDINTLDATAKRHESWLKNLSHNREEMSLERDALRTKPD